MRLAAVALLVVVAGCDTRIAEPTATGRTVVQLPGTQTLAITGRWSFTRVLQTADGTVHMSQTIWQFAAGGAVTRTVYADNLSAGVGDAVVTSGTWSADSRTVRILFDGSTVPTQFDYQLSGNTLTMGGITFVRLP